MKNLKNVVTFVTLLCTVLQTCACLIGLYAGFETKQGGKGFRASPGSYVDCTEPYSNMTSYMFPAFRLGCWLTEPSKEP
jgi:hypothetical protein